MKKILALCAVAATLVTTSSAFARDFVPFSHHSRTGEAIFGHNSFGEAVFTVGENLFKLPFDLALGIPFAAVNAVSDGYHHHHRHVHNLFLPSYHHSSSVLTCYAQDGYGYVWESTGYGYNNVQDGVARDCAMETRTSCVYLGCEMAQY